MTLLPCPVCGAEPEAAVEQWEEGRAFVARCLCSMAVGRSREDLRRRWNRLLCANDPATAEDCA